jgi:predicted phosphodiesterase
MSNYSLSENGISTLLKSLKVYFNFPKFHSKNIKRLYQKILDKELEQFEPNSSDTLILLITVFLYYGEDSEEYKKVYEYIYKTSQVDLGWSSIIKSSFKPNKKIFINPILDIKGDFLDELVDRNCYFIKPSGRIALLSDWATGTTSAKWCLECITSYNPDYFIHLGDVYYSGTIKEFEKNLLQPIESILPPTTKSFIIPGNHDYYSGSDGLHYALKKLDQTASYFSLYNDSIQIEGIDTGFNDGNIINSIFQYEQHPTYVVESEERWHNHRFSEAKKKNRKIILLSHHQIISNIHALDMYQNKKSPLNKKLFDFASPILDQTVLWFFGHDHAFNIFESYTYNGLTVQRPRLIGNGSCQSREDNLSKCQSVTTEQYEKSIQESKFIFGDDSQTEDLHPPLPRVKNITPGNFKNILNNCFVILDYNENGISVNYYEIPMLELGKFEKPRILYYEKIIF